MVSLNNLTPEFHPERRIQATFTSAQFLGHVFSLEEQSVVSGLLENLSTVATVKAGGRRIRDLLNCTTIDVAGQVASDAVNMLDAIDTHRIQPIVEILKAYPDAQKSRPDADIFVWGADLSQVALDANQRGLSTNIIVATGNIPVLEIVGENGSATLVDGQQSWQTQEWWPKYAVKAPLVTGEKGAVYQVDCAWDSLFTFPLEIPGIHLFDVLSPERVTVVGRSLLWQELSTDPRGRRLKEPSLNTQREVLRTVGAFGELLDRIAVESSLIQHYASGIRDMALALRVRVTNDPISDYTRNIAGTFLESFRK